MLNKIKNNSHKAFEELVQKIPQIFEKLDDKRREQLNDIKAIQDKIYALNDGSINNWESSLELPNIYEQHQTLKAHLIDSLYSNPEALFDVTTASNDLQNMAIKQKIMLTDALEKMKIANQIEKIVENIIETGECTLFVGWQTRYKTVRRAILIQKDVEVGASNNNALKGQEIALCSGGEDAENIVKNIFDVANDAKSLQIGAYNAINEESSAFKISDNSSPVDVNKEPKSPSREVFTYEKKIIFDGATVKTIDAQDFVFDDSRKNNWDACPKIFRTYLTLDELISDKNNNYLTQDIEADLAQLTYSKNFRHTDNSNQRDSRQGVRNGQIEILEYWGDIELSDGTLLKNWYIVCAGRRAIVRFEPNPFVNSPFIYANLIENPTTKRGISPLKCVLPLNNIASKILNTQLDAYSLVVNPPYLAPKGAFKGQQTVSPGKIIEYDSSLLPQSPVPLNFTNALSGWDFVEYFKNSIENTTGIYRTMAGNVANPNRTATELIYSANGQNARLNLAIDTINRKIILPMVEKIADTIANFKFGNQLVTRQIKNKPVVFEIDDATRQADYIYRYSDRKASLERKFKQKELAETITAFAGIPEFSNKINWKECFKYALEQMGVENSEKYLTESD